MKETTRPELKLGRHLLPGLAAVALFVVLALTIAGSEFGAGEGFPTDVSITAAIGYAMFDLSRGGVPAEGFLAAFEIVDVLLVAALAAAVMLARTESEGRVVTALTDGGFVPGRSDSGDSADGDATDETHTDAVTDDHATAADDTAVSEGGDR